MFPNLKLSITTILFVVVNTFVFSQNQDINLQGNSNDIFDAAANSPSISNNTDFGNIAVNVSSQFTFTIQNTHSGGSPSNNKLTVSNITVSGTNSSEFVVSGISLPAIIDRSNSTTFIVTFTPTASGNRTATITIDNDSSVGSEQPYTFNLQGLGDATLTSLTLINTFGLTVPEPSGLAYDSNTNQLFTVSDNTGFVYSLSTTGTILGTLNYSGSDLEGVSMYTSDKILIAVEGSRELVEYDYVIDNGAVFTSHVMNYTNTDLTATGDNSRIEGVTYDAVNDEIYFLNEKNPGALIKADGSFNVVNEYPDPLSHGGDYSGSCYVPETGRLWLASDQTSTIYLCNTDGTIIQSFPVTQAGGADIDKLEGIAIDYANQLLYAVSDAGENLFVFQINDPLLNTADNTTSETIIKVFPNPTKNYLTIKLNNSEEIQKTNFYNTLGKLVKSTNTNNQIIYIRDLNSGIYFLEVFTNNTKYIKTIIKH